MNNIRLTTLRGTLKQFLDELEQCNTSDMEAIKKLDQELKNIVSQIASVLPNISKAAKTQRILLPGVDDYTVSHIDEQISRVREFIKYVISMINHILAQKLKCRY